MLQHDDPAGPRLATVRKFLAAREAT
ncbi:MAG: hypothetical protein JWM31_1018, partial [Solirubrobacterales bacterium]|nr:hypothetical protein [Solirubrobacterales bacterium]